MLLHHPSSSISTLDGIKRNEMEELINTLFPIEINSESSEKLHFVY